jgi:hypothetical protein
MALNVSLFASATDTTPQLRVGLSFPELCELLGPPKSYLTKEAAPLYSPAEWLPGRTRGKDAIAAIHFGVLDLDHCTPDDLVDIVVETHRRGLAYYVATTWRHGAKSDKDACARLLVPFSRPVLVSEWPRFWRAFNDEVARGRADEQCKDASRSYFLPSFCEGRHLEPFCDGNPDGAALDVDAVLAKAGGFVAASDLPTTPASSGLSRETLRNLGLRLLRSRNEHNKIIGLALGRIVRGEPYAREPGTLGSVFDTGAVLPEGRNDMTFKVLAKVCEHHPQADVQSLVDLLKPSLALMGAPSEDEIRSMIDRLQAGARQAHSMLVFEALGRYEPYSDQELQILADRAEISLSQLRRRWIVQKGKVFYFLRHDGYRAYLDIEAEVAGSRELAPAIRAGVDTVKVMQNGVRPKTIKELVHDYGTVAREVVVDLTAQYSYYEESSQTIFEAPRPVRVKAREHKDVDEWLKVFAGAKYNRLCQWLAVLPALSEPCAALYLEGDPGVGKSLLAVGVSRIWADAPAALKDTMGNFNDALLACPLVFADEKAPVDERGRVRTDELREFIQARERPLRRKFRDVATIKGCARIVLAANNRNLLQTSEHLTEADIAAIVERIFYLHVSAASAEHLRRLKKESPETLERWVDGNAIAEHALFLAETLHVPRTNRFLVAGDASDLTNSLAVGTGLRASVAQWLVSYLLDPARLARCSKSHTVMPLVRVNRGRFFVASRAIHEAWSEYVQQDYQPPTPMAVSRALAGLSKEITLYIGNKNQKFRHVDMEYLVEWAAETGYATREELEEALVRIEAGIIVVTPVVN